MIDLIIPAYEPDQRLIDLLESFDEEILESIIIIDDGSGSEYLSLFNTAESLVDPYGGIVLHHDKNQGKGRALKTGFEYILKNRPLSLGAVTADSDGQHTKLDIKRMMASLNENPDSLILGVRDFTGENIPWKSRMGNNLTIAVFALASGVKIHDTQTGLRGIPKKYMEELLALPGERFEFETKMLLDAADRKMKIVEIPIETVYDSTDNHQTHFNPITDSWKIYKILLAQFGKYILSSLSASLLDLVAFTIFSHLFFTIFPATYIMIATVFARVISSIYNFIINSKAVFHSEEKAGMASIKYFSLVIVQMLMSGFLVTLLSRVLPLPVVLVKVVIDVILFFLSFYIQKKFVFRKQSYMED